MVYSHAVDAAHPLQPDEKACDRCGRAFIAIGRKRYCSTACAAKPVQTAAAKARHAAADKARGSTTDRGYGYEHQKRRARMLPDAIGTLCPLCGKVMLASQKLHLDHIQPMGIGGSMSGPGRIVHGSCNQSRGDTLKHGWKTPRAKRW